MTKMCDMHLTQRSKHKDRLDSYPCIASAVLDASDNICHKLIVEIVFMIFIVFHVEGSYFYRGSGLGLGKS